MSIFQGYSSKIFIFLFVSVLVISAQTKPQQKVVLANFEKNIENGKLGEVERELLSYVIANPTDANGFSLLAKLRFKQDRLNEAKSLATKALSLDEKLISAQMILAETLINLGEIEQSKKLLNGIPEKEISENTLILNLSRNFLLVGDCPKAILLAERLPLKIRNSNALPIRLNCSLAQSEKKEFSNLIQLAKPLAKENPGLAIEVAKILSSAGMHQNTVDLMSQAILSFPKNTEALLVLAESEISIKHFKNAKVHLNQVEKLEPVSEKLFFTNSLLEIEQGNDQVAFEFLEKSLALNSSNLRALKQYVAVALRLNQKGKAFRASERLLSLQPKNLDYLYLFGVASLQNNNFEKAENSLIEYLDSRPEDPRGCLALGLTYAGQPEKLVQARSQLQNCLKINPNNYEAVYQLGLSYKTIGDSSKAIEYFEQAVKISPNYANAWRDLGSGYLETGIETKARPSLEKAFQINPNDADTNFQLSRLYNLLGERELAKKHLELFQKLKNPKKYGM